MKTENLSKKIKIFLKRFVTWQLFLGIFVGALGGYAYYYFVGCNSGTCAITSNPLNTTAYGMLMGALLGFKEKKKETPPEIKTEN